MYTFAVALHGVPHGQRTKVLTATTHHIIIIIIITIVNHHLHHTSASHHTHTYATCNQPTSSGASSFSTGLQQNNGRRVRSDVHTYRQALSHKPSDFEETLIRSRCPASVKEDTGFSLMFRADSSAEEVGN